MSQINTDKIASNSGGTTALTIADDGRVAVTGVLTASSITQNAGPAFSAYQSSGQTLSTNTFTKIQFQTEEFDTNSNYDAATNYRFTPNVAGYYKISASLSLNASNAGINLTIYKNGSLFKRLQNTYNTTTFAASGSVLIYFNGSTDYAEVYSQTSTGQLLEASLAATWFQGILVRAA